jgi:hypothetical protein
MLPRLVTAMEAGAAQTPTRKFASRLVGRDREGKSDEKDSEALDSPPPVDLVSC